MDEISRVGPGGYVHGWIKVGGVKALAGPYSSDVKFMKTEDVGKLVSDLEPGMTVEERYQKFPEKRKDQTQGQLDKAITKRGWQPSALHILNGERLTDGHHTYAAARERGVSHLPVLHYQRAKRMDATGTVWTRGPTGMSDTWTRRSSDLKYGHGSALWEYWTKGAGFAEWSGALHKWTALRDLLLKAGVPAASAGGLTTNIIQAVMPRYMKQAHAAMEHKAGRSGMAKQDVTDSPAPAASRAEYMRLYALEDIHILRSADGGDGRTVEAYAAVFGEPAEIQDHEGHYIEVIDPGAFNRAIDHASRARGGFPGSVKVLWNHGRDLSGTPSDRFSMPIGIPVEIRAEARGLLTRTRYSETPLADEVLENIRAGSITSQSFTGRIMRSDPQLGRGERYRPDRAGNLRTVSRTELGLREYGPVLWPAYSGAEIVGVRMSTPGAYARDPDELDEALPPDEEPAAGDPLTRASGDEHSARYHQHALYVLRSKEARERAGLVW